jgi:hypothetical protein
MSLFNQVGGGFGRYDAFDPETLPEPGPFLQDHEVLVGREHAAFHRLSRVLFEERGVYDATFGYNLARLNLDEGHPDAGFRYARESDDVLRAEFTPTTAMCPQAGTLVEAASRAWNDLSEYHEYDFVRVRVAPSHSSSEAINDSLSSLPDGGDAGE